MYRHTLSVVSKGTRDVFRNKIMGRHIPCLQVMSCSTRYQSKQLHSTVSNPTVRGYRTHQMEEDHTTKLHGGAYTTRYNEYQSKSIWSTKFPFDASGTGFVTVNATGAHSVIVLPTWHDSCEIMLCQPDKLENDIEIQNDLQVDSQQNRYLEGWSSRDKLVHLDVILPSAIDDALSKTEQDILHAIATQKDTENESTCPSACTINLSSIENAIGRYYLVMCLPQACNLDIIVTECTGQVELADKFEGNISVRADKAFIKASKLRGETISLLSGNGNINIGSLIEGSQVQMYGKHIEFQRLLAEQAELVADIGMKGGAVFASAATFETIAGGVDLQTLHGAAEIRVKEDNIVLEDIHGAVYANISKQGDIRARFETLLGKSELTAGSKTGNVDVAVSSKVAQSSEITCTAHEIKLPPDSRFDNMVTQNNDLYHWQGRLLEQTDTQTEDSVKHVPAAYGKINQSIAEKMGGSFYESNLFNKSDESDSDASKSTSGKPNIVCKATQGTIQLKTTSWADRILNSKTA